MRVWVNLAEIMLTMCVKITGNSAGANFDELRAGSPKPGAGFEHLFLSLCFR